MYFFSYNDDQKKITCLKKGNNYDKKKSILIYSSTHEKI